MPTDVLGLRKSAAISLQRETELPTASHVRLHSQFVSALWKNSNNVGEFWGLPRLPQCSKNMECLYNLLARETSQHLSRGLADERTHPFRGNSGSKKHVVSMVPMKEWGSRVNWVFAGYWAQGQPLHQQRDQEMSL